MTEEDFRCYPLRGDSLARFSQLYDQRLAGGRGWLELTPGEAATHLSRPAGASIRRARRGWRSSLRARIAAHLVQPAPAKHGFHRFASEFFDWNDPPFFKQFLRLDADPATGVLNVRCHGTSGCAHAGTDPPVEDEFSVPL